MNLFYFLLYSIILLLLKINRAEDVPTDNVTKIYELSTIFEIENQTIAVDLNNITGNVINELPQNESDPFDFIEGSWPKIKNWDAEVEFNVKPAEYHNYHSHDDPVVNGRNFENVNTFSGELQRLLESNRQPFRSEATVGGYIHQDLDHFDNTETRKWKQFFYYNTHNHNGNGLNFLILGGEGSIYESQVLDNASMLMIWAKAFGANAYALEHRFYGDSQPTGNLATESLKYLNSEQALADAAVFIKSIDRKQKFSSPKWVVFGGSYPGNLAAWLRLKYPHLVMGAVASSAPVEARHEFTEFYQVVHNSIRSYGGDDCLKNVQTFLSNAQKLIKFKEGRSQLGICKNDAFDDKDAEYYMETQVSRLGWEVQADGVDHAKLAMSCQTSAHLAARATIKHVKDSKSRGVVCTEYSYKKYVKKMQDTTPTWYRAWLWQTCTQFGYFQTTDRTKSAFQEAFISYKYYSDLCNDVFGQVYKGHNIQHIVSQTNNIYGGALNFNGTNVVFVNGSEDPWHPLSIYTATNRPYIRSIFIKGTSHCRDMYAPNVRDPPALISARKTIQAHIAAWIR